MEQMSGEEFGKISKEYSDLSCIVEKITEYKNIVFEISGLKEMISSDDLDQEMRELCVAELSELEDNFPVIERALKVALLPRDEADSKNAIIEIRAGTGGEEA